MKEPARRLAAGQSGQAGEGRSESVFAWCFDLLRNARSLESQGPLGAALASLKPHYIATFWFSGAVSILYLSSSLYMMLVYDRVLNSGSETTLIVLTIALMAALATLAAVDVARGRLLVRAGAGLEQRLSGPLADRLIAGGAGGTMRSRQAMQDLDQFRAVATGQPMLGLLDAPWAPLYLVFLFLLHWAFALLTLVGGLIFFGVAYWNERRLRAPTKAALDAQMEANGALEGTLRHAGAIRALGMQDGLKAGWARTRASATTLSAGAGFDNAAASGVLKFLRLLLQSLALALGAFLALEGQITAGAMIAGSILLGRALAPVEQIVGGWRPLVTASEHYARLKALFEDGAREDAERMRLPAPTGRLSVEQLFVLGSDQKPIVSNVSFQAAPGEILAIVGPSGAGKTTLARALVGLAPAAGGVIRLDDAPLPQWRDDERARAIGFLPQELALLPGTVRENISRFEARLDAPPADVDVEVVAAAQRARVHEAILHLPSGYETGVDIGGMLLSGGQKQRIALARALYRDPAVLVLDEPNAHLCSDGEAKLVDALRALKAAGRTVILITHRQPLVVLADKILRLAQGRVEAFGPRDQVLAAAQARPAGRPAAVATLEALRTGTQS
jgi:ATP-binding cassette, subfamily C, bacterial